MNMTLAEVLPLGTGDGEVERKEESPVGDSGWGRRHFSRRAGEGVECIQPESTEVKG